MTEEANTQKRDDKPFLESLQAVEQDDKNYLGDYEGMEAMLRFYTATLIEDLEQVTDNKQRIKEMKSVAKEVSLILLGYEGRKFIKVRKWNRPGGIDAFCAKWLGLAETDPKDRMEHAFIVMFNEILDIAEFAGTDGALEEQWQPAVDAVFSRFTNLFMGIDPVTELMMLG